MPKTLSILLKPASSLCNLRCRYCFYADEAKNRTEASHGLMSEEATEKLLARIRSGLEPGDRVSFVFQGGEPTLAGLGFYERFVSRTEAWKDVRVSYAIQTNGLLLGDEWCEFLKKHGFLVGISWDLLTECHDMARVDPEGKGTEKRVLEVIRRMEKYGVEYNVLCTLTNSVARHPESVWKRLGQAGIGYVQFTPCIGSLDGGKDGYALTPERFFSFYDRLFSLWYRDFRAGKYRSVKLFDDLVQYIAFGIPTACGMDGRCRRQLVVEADGSVYPCDFYCLDEYRLGDLTEESLGEILSASDGEKFAAREDTTPELCAGCELERFCGGGCRRMRREVYCVPGGSFCGYQAFLRKHGETLGRIAAMERQARGGME